MPPSPDKEQTRPKEKELFSNRTVLITGGTSGIGRTTAEMLHGLGATVIIGTRERANFEKVCLELGGARTFPFIANLTELDAVDEAIETLIAKGLAITDIIHSAAEGMGPFTRELIKRAYALRKARGQPDFPTKLAELKEKTQDWVAETQDFAEAVNFSGPIAFIEKIREKQVLGPRPKVLVFFSSFWSSFYPDIPVPTFYRGVAESKGRFERWLEKQTPNLIAGGIYPAIISGNLIIDTNVGRMFERFLFPLIPEDKQPSLESFPKREDIARATVEVLTRDPLNWPEYPLRRFVVAPGQTLNHLSPQDPIFQQLLVL